MCNKWTYITIVSVSAFYGIISLYNIINISALIPL